MIFWNNPLLKKLPASCWDTSAAVLTTSSTASGFRFFISGDLAAFFFLTIFGTSMTFLAGTWRSWAESWMRTLIMDSSRLAMTQWSCSSRETSSALSEASGLASRNGLKASSGTSGPVKSLRNGFSDFSGASGVFLMEMDRCRLAMKTSPEVDGSNPSRNEWISSIVDSGSSLPASGLVRYVSKMASIAANVLV